MSVPDQVTSVPAARPTGPVRRTGAPSPSPAASAGRIRLERLTKRYGETTVIDDLSLTVEPGTFFALLGPSGCGKTTTLRTIGGFEAPTHGQVFLGDDDVTALPPNRRDVNTVFQSYALFPHLTVRRNVQFGLERRGVRRAEVRRRAMQALESVQLAHLAERRPAALSGGQQQRVALARALVNRPRALLLDEPLGALDLQLRRQLQLELARIQHEVGITFLHVTHDQEEAMALADRIAVMNAGRIEQAGTPRELYDAPRTAFVATVLGRCNLVPVVPAGLDGEHRVVRPASGAALRVARARATVADGPMAAGVRPERVRIAAAAAAEPGGGPGNRLEARVLTSAFLGAALQYDVETAAGEPFTVIVRDDERVHGPVLPDGSAVELRWEPEDTFLVRAPDD